MAKTYGVKTPPGSVETTQRVDMRRIVSESGRFVAPKKDENIIASTTASGLDLLETAVDGLVKHITYNTELVATAYWNWRNGCSRTPINGGPVVIDLEDENHPIYAGNLIPEFPLRPIKGPGDDGDYVYCLVELAVRKKPKSDFKQRNTKHQTVELHGEDSAALENLFGN